MFLRVVTDHISCGEFPIFQIGFTVEVHRADEDYVAGGWENQHICWHFLVFFYFNDVTYFEILPGSRFNNAEGSVEYACFPHV